VEKPLILKQEEDNLRIQAATLDLELHRKETGGYRYNLSGRQPSVYVIMRPNDDPDFPLTPVHVTVSPEEAEAHSEFGEDVLQAQAQGTRQEARREQRLFRTAKGSKR